MKRIEVSLVTMAMITSCLLSSQVSVAQERWSLEFRPGLNIPTGKLGDADLKTGVGFEGTIAYRFLPHLSIYAGWGWNRFAADQSFAGSDVDFEETGYTYGLQFIHPIGESKINMLARVGALSNHIEVEEGGGSIIADSGHGYKAGLGWQIEGGVAIPMNDKWRLLPGIRYRHLPRELEIGPGTTEVKLRYLSIGVGIARLF